MELLIDGHNLIGAGVFDDIHLSDEDDEAKLVARLKVWRSRYKGKITVVFDRGIPGGRDRDLSGGGVDVIFAASPTEADDLIQSRLERNSNGLELVSNDAKLVAIAWANGVASMRGAELVERFTFPEPTQAEPGEEQDVQVGTSEVEEWLNLFESKPPRISKRRFSRKLRPRKRK